MEKPLNVLSQKIGSRVIVRVRSGLEYRGTLDGYDPHLNVVLKDVGEFENGTLKERSRLKIVRGDNIVFISP